MSVYLANAVALPVQRRVQHTANRVRETRENVAGNEFFAFWVCVLLTLLICNVAGETESETFMRGVSPPSTVHALLLILWHMC